MRMERWTEQNQLATGLCMQCLLLCRACCTLFNRTPAQRLNPLSTLLAKLAPARPLRLLAPSADG